MVKPLSLENIDQHSGTILFIEVPPKIWSSKVISCYQMTTYTDIDYVVFKFESYGKYVFHPKNNWNAVERSDIIVFIEPSDMEELNKDLRLGKYVIPENRIKITNMIKKFWEYFCLKGCHRTIIGYKLATDAGINTPVCCRRP